MAAVTVLPPFLQKLKKVAETIPGDVSTWNEDGDAYVVKDSDKFELALKKFYKGSLQTFVRQLHFYGFRKLETQTGAWSFTHPNFRRDRPELLSEIRRKSRADAQMTATQVEVQQLKTQVSHLQGVIEDLRSQLDSVLTVLDDAGIVTITREPSASPDAKEPIKVAAKAGGASRKRSRIVQGSANPADTETEAPKIAQTQPPQQQRNVKKENLPLQQQQQQQQQKQQQPKEQQQQQQQQATTQAAKPLAKQVSKPQQNENEERQAQESKLELSTVKMDTSSEPSTSAPPSPSAAACAEAASNNVAPPLSRAASFGELCSNIEPLDLEETMIAAENDLEMLGDFELSEEADLIYRELMAANTQEQRDGGMTDEAREAMAKSTAEIVAQATELDPTAVNKVLGFLQQAVSSKGSEEFSEELSIPQIQRAVRAYQRFAKASPLPAQQVRA
ncbi:Heat shock transcription factor, putative [Hondaea fermentalgiana]|uniref:Heat shock transcription factor, putative n=1 Tax=Hondaea fermentalgiana TaxID=2315210 RepID=A0A2R5G8L0_9STRA|nr:Heat shock transcription factor, putative [Hondaea fermentalgiana]|eukprot:GBG26118.1 Heat shock transcription factor, putative [Hondaea fermentalgiana]